MNKIQRSGWKILLECMTKSTNVKTYTFRVMLLSIKDMLY